LATGLRDGGLFLWDLSTCSTSHKIKGHHKGPITAIEFNQHENTILTGGSDGFIKLWDPRRGNSAQDTLVQRISAHCEQGIYLKYLLILFYLLIFYFYTILDNDGGIKSAVVSCMAQIRDGNYLISGGSDNSIVLMDSRRNYEVIEKWSNHAKNCVYSMCTVGDSCVLVGDGVGKLLCYDLISCELKYGLGASEQGKYSYIYLSFSLLFRLIFVFFIYFHYL
jgi:WD40 repeat protein